MAVCPSARRVGSRATTSRRLSPVSGVLLGSGIQTATPPGAPARYRTGVRPAHRASRSEEHTSELQSRLHLVCRLLLEKKKEITNTSQSFTFPLITHNVLPSVELYVTSTYFFLTNCRSFYTFHPSPCYILIIAILYIVY